MEIFGNCFAFFHFTKCIIKLVVFAVVVVVVWINIKFFNKQQHSLPSGLFVFIIDSNLNQFKFDWLLSKYVNMMIENIICKCYFAIWFEFWMSIFYGYAENIVKGFMVAATTAVTCYYSHLYSRELKAFIFFPFMILMIMMRKFLMYQEKKNRKFYTTKCTVFSNMFGKDDNDYYYIIVLL